MPNSSKTPAAPRPPNSGTSEQVLQLQPNEVHAIAHALADPRRFEMLQQIASEDSLLCGKLHVQEMLSPATISHHLRELQEAGLVEAERRGRQMCLTLRRPIWNAYLRYLQHL